MKSPRLLLDRQLLDKFAKLHNIVSPSQWANVKLDDVIGVVGHSVILRNGVSFFNVLQNIYPGRDEHF